MARWVSFIVLLVILLLLAVLFFQVFAQFLLPVFLAVLLTVIFAPLHRWFVKRCHGRDWLAALATTLTILLIALLPLTWVVFRSITELIQLAQGIDQTALRATMGTMTDDLRTTALGLGVELPTNEQIVAEITRAVQRFATPLAVGGVQILIGVLTGLFIMIVSLYYFLLDGPKMIVAVTRLFPLDEKYARQLVKEFGMISRAVVMATLVTAIVQGLLSGVAYWLVGLEMAFLLMTLTMLLAFVPFLGAAAVWVPCSFWLYFHDGRAGAAIFLFLFGAIVISMVDNLLKPFLLAGRANLHPLLALLSVLGGVQSLGPIGILVGPMVVSFLQALLIMLRTELEEFSKPAAPA